MKDLVDGLRVSATGNRLARSTFWCIVSALSSRGLALLSSVWVARILGKQGYGEFGIIQSTVGVFGTLAGFGLGTTATKYLAELRTRDVIRAGRIIALTDLFALTNGGVMSLVLLASASWLASHMLGAPHLAGYLRLSALLLFLNAINGAQTGALAGLEAFRAIARTSFWCGILSFPFVVGGVYLAGIRGAVCGLVGCTAVSCIINFVALRCEARSVGIHYSLAGCTRELGVLWQFSLPTTLGSVMVGPITWACSVLLVRQPNGYAEMGIYSAAYTFHSVLVFAASTVGTPLLPMIANQGDSKNWRLERANMLMTWLLGVMLALPLLCLPEFVQVIYGSVFADPSMIRTFITVVFFTCIVIYKQGLSRVLTANGLMWWSLLSNMFWGLSLLASALFLVRWGALGLALAFAIAYVLNTVIFLPLYISRHLVPKNTILSTEAVVIWLVLCSSGAMAWLGTPLAVRILAFPLATTVVIGSFARLSRSPRDITATG